MQYTAKNMTGLSKVAKEANKGLKFLDTRYTKAKKRRQKQTKAAKSKQKQTKVSKSKQKQANVSKGK